MKRGITFTIWALSIMTFQTHAGSLDWLFDVPGNDDFARKQAQFLVWDGVPHLLSATFEKVEMLDKDWPYYLFNVVMTNSGIRADHGRSSYLVCFRLTERTTEFRIVTVIQNVSNPPTQQEITIDKRLNGWAVAPPWRAEDDLPHKIRGSGLDIVLDKCRAGSGQ